MARAMAQPKPELAGPVAVDGGNEDVDRIAVFSGFSTYPQPVDCGTTTLSAFGDVEYVTDLIRPGRIHVIAAEEGTGKTFAAVELGIRMAGVGGDFAGTWHVECTGAVLHLSEMHPDDDYAYQQAVLDSLGVHRSAISGAYYRLDLGSAANGAPALTDTGWCDWFISWTQLHDVRLAIFDTATGATQVDPWGKDIQQVYRDLRAMLAQSPELAIMLVLHLKKPQGRGARRISDVLGEWARWCDVLVLLEDEGADRTKISTHKRLRHHKRIAATRAGGLLIDPVDLVDGVPTRKVSDDKVLAAIAAQPGISYRQLGQRLGVGKSTAENYVKARGEQVTRTPSGPKGAIQLTVTTRPPSTAQHEDVGGSWAVPEEGEVGHRPTTPPPYMDKAVGWAVTAPSERDDLPVEKDYPASAWEAD
jgi:hypothetical protein